MDESLRALAAQVVGCTPADILAVAVRDGGLSVVWGIGWKRFFPDVVAPVVERVQTVEISTVDDVEGLHALFPERLAKVLIRAGFDSPGAVAAATDDQLRAVGGVGPKTLRDIRELLPYPQQ